jgi:hypothetical protein
VEVVMVIAPRLRRFHRWHALAMSLVVIASAGSGLIHTWMSHSQPPPPAARPAGEVDLSAATLPPSALSAGLPATAGKPVSASLRPLDGDVWWQIICDGQTAPIWRHATTGAIDDAADARYAAQIAARAMGGGSVRQTAYLTAFDAEYIAIFGILPVYRFDADDAAGTRVYVSTMTGSVTRATDDHKQWEADVFSLLHKWNFIPWRPLRDWALLIAMASLILLACGGIVLFFTTRQRAQTGQP